MSETGRAIGKKTGSGYETTDVRPRGIIPVLGALVVLLVAAPLAMWALYGAFLAADHTQVPAAYWTFYTPYSTLFSNTHVVLAVVGAFIVGFSSILTGLNFIATVHTMRAPGLT